MAEFKKSWRNAYDKATYTAATVGTFPHGVNDPNSSHYLKTETYTQSETNSLLSAKEPVITAGTTSQYWRGDKSWQDFNTSARASISASYPLTYNSSTGAFGLGYNTTNLKLTLYELNTIQDIATTSSPTFATLNLTGSDIHSLKISNPASTSDKQFTIGVGSPGQWDDYALFMYDNQLTMYYAPGGNGQFGFSKYAVFNAGGTVQGGVAGALDWTIYNTLNDPAAGAVLNLSVLHPGAYDPFIAWNIAWGDGSYRMGIDNSDDDKLKIGCTYWEWGDSYTPLTITRDGKIGIYNQAPNEALEVAGNIHVSGGDRTIFNRSNNYLAFGTNNTESFRIINNGNIGIGTTSATEKLSLSGNFNQTGNYSFYNNFTSGWTGSGWRLDFGVSTAAKSTLEIDTLWVRGTMNVYELIINQIRATNGSFFISSTAKLKSYDPSDPYDMIMDFEDPENYGFCPFLVNDILLIQRVKLDSSTIIKKIYLSVLGVTGTQIQFEYLGTPVGALAIGDAVVRIGNSSNTARQGSIYLTSDDSASPYMDIIDGVNSYDDWQTTAVRKVRLGKLSGLTDSNFGALSGYGLYATNAYLKGGIWATFGNIAGWTITSTQLASPIINFPLGTSGQVYLDANSSTKDYGLHINFDITQDLSSEWLSVGSIKDSYGDIQANEQGVSYAKDGSWYFRLTNSYKQIAGWSFTNIMLSSPSGKLNLRSDTNTIYAAPLTGLVKYVMFGQTYSGTAYTGKYGISAIDNSNRYIFRLDDGACSIASWNFDYTKLTIGSATAGISLNTSSSPFITGSSAKGFEVYDSSDPKLFIGKKDGNYLDWNVTTADTLTVKGTMIGSAFSTGTVFAGGSTYGSLYSGFDGVSPTLTLYKYTDANNYISTIIRSSTSYNTFATFFARNTSYQLTEIIIGFGTTDYSGYMSIDGKNVTRTHTRGTTLPSTNIKQGDSFYKSDTNKWYMYDTSAGWVLLN